MAYSDYGGYAYRNGDRVTDRSDATITPEGNTYGTPGNYPAFARLDAGMDYEDVVKTLEWPSGHAILGDGPIYLVLYKQRVRAVFRGPERIFYILHESGDGKLIRVCVEDHTIEIIHTEEDNHYVYAKMTQPNGIVWHGWSGYGVGAGFEDNVYGYSTLEREIALAKHWPDDFKHRAFPSLTCGLCENTGKRWYYNTDTWRGTLGEYQQTQDTCDRCWGSGNESEPGPNLSASNADLSPVERAEYDRLMRMRIGDEPASEDYDFWHYPTRQEVRQRTRLAGNWQEDAEQDEQDGQDGHYPSDRGERAGVRGDDPADEGVGDDGKSDVDAD